MVWGGIGLLTCDKQHVMGGLTILKMVHRVSPKESFATFIAVFILVLCGCTPIFAESCPCQSVMQCPSRNLTTNQAFANVPTCRVINL